MNPEPPDEPTLETIRRHGEEFAADVQDRAVDTLHDLESRIRSNPWLFIGGALAVGVVIAALLPRHRSEPKKLEAVRDWLRDAYENVNERLPDRADVQSAVQSLDIPGRIDCLRKKLHLD